jgi:hypothetical protein
MKREMLWIGLAALLVPIFARLIWFYPGVPSRPEIPTPDYESLTIPRPTLETQNVVQEDANLTGGVVLVDYFHANQFQPAEIQSLREAVEGRGGRLETITDSTSLTNRLKYASSLIVISPSVAFTSDEIRAVTKFVERGGRLAVFTDATRGLTYTDFFTGATISMPDINAVNPLLANHGISVNNDYLYNLIENEGNFRNVFFGDFGKDELTFGLTQVAFYGTHSVEAESGQILLLGADQTYSSITDAHNPAEGGAALSEDGNVVAFGDFTFMTPPYNTVSDNGILIANIADFLLGSTLKPSLATFPYVFSQPDLQVYPSSKVQMTAEIVGALGRLQTSLQAVNVNMQISTKEPTDGDKLILGTFTPTEDLVPFLEPFDLQMDESSEFVELPGFGNIGRLGNGILLFESGTNGNTIILLADTVTDLTYLLDAISSGSLGSCVLQGDIGLCSIGFGGGFSEETGGVISTEGTPTGEPTTGEVTPEATPTPVATPAG